MKEEKKLIYCKILNRFCIYPFSGIRAISNIADELIVNKEDLRPILFELKEMGFLDTLNRSNSQGTKWKITELGLAFYKENRFLIKLF